MSETLSDYIGASKRKGDVGIEVEVEFNAPFDVVPPKGWQMHNDNSLRNFGVEFVTDGPVKLDTVLARTTDVCEYIAKHAHDGSSTRSSVHVHVNCLRLTPIQILNGLLFSWLIEDSLLAQCASHRKNNRFCLTMKNAPILIKKIESLVAQHDFAFGVDQNHFKYANVAFHNLNRIGTLEFRGLQGVYDPKKITAWTELVHDAVMKPALKFQDPYHMWQELKKDLGLAKYLLDHKIQIDHKGMEENYWLIYNLIEGTDWDEYKQAWDKYWEAGRAIKKKPAPGEMRDIWDLDGNHIVAQAAGVRNPEDLRRAFNMVNVRRAGGNIVDAPVPQMPVEDPVVRRR